MKNEADPVIIKNYAEKRVLITGGLGMIGSSIARRLVELGAAVTIADAKIEGFGANNFNIRKIKDEVKVYKADIRDKKAMTPLVESCDIIFNLAGQVSHNDSIADPFYDTELNYLGHMNILEIVKNVNRNIKLIYSGTRMQYGRVEKIPVSEDYPLRPLSPYALNKTAAENLYLFYNRLYGIPVVIFRITNPYGPGGQVKHNKYNMVNWFTRLALEKKEITIYGNGSQIRDYIYIEDLTEALVMAGIDPENDGEVFNLGSGSGITFREMAETIVSVAGSGSIVQVPWPDDYVNIETGDFVANIDKIKKAYSWAPRVPFRKGIELTCSHFRNYIEHYL